MNDRRERASPTSRDVAAHANVSQSTVSLVFSGKDAGRISAETRRAVLDAADALGYRPNASARALKLGTPRLIALAVPNVSNPYFAAVLKAAANAARDEGYGIMLIDVGDDPADGERLIASLSAHAFDGLVMWENPWSAAAAEHFPATVIVADGDVPGGASVFISAPDIMRTAIDHLAGLGHSRIARLGFDLSAPPFRSRANAFRDCLVRRGLPFDPAWDLEVPFGSTAAPGIAELLADRCRPTAVVCDDDLLAPLAYRAAKIAGVSVPEDLSVVGIDDLELARLLEPQLTTVAIPALALGRTVIEAALEKIRDAEGQATRRIETHLVVRSSTARVQ